MPKQPIATGVVHTVPTDLKNILLSKSELLEIWNNLTPLSRNEWICWITIVKKPDTRKKHLDRLRIDLPKGIHRPCCWPGCPHRQSKTKK